MLGFLHIVHNQVPSSSLVFSNTHLLKNLWMSHTWFDEGKGFFQLQVPRRKFQSKLFEVESWERIGDEGFKVILKVGKTDIDIKPQVSDLDANILAMNMRSSDDYQIEHIDKIGVFAASQMVGMNPDGQQGRPSSIQCFFDQCCYLRQVFIGNIEPIQDELETDQIRQVIKTLLNEA